MDFSKNKYILLYILLCFLIAASGFWAFISVRHALDLGPDSPPSEEQVFKYEPRPPLPKELEGLKQALPPTEYPAGMLDKYKEIYAINKDVIGWIKIKGTSIDTLITQHSNNNYYLRTGFYKKYNRYGNAYLDYRAGVENLSQNSVIYGHSGRDETQVFSVLFDYLDYDFYINNPIIEFGTIYKDYKWKIFSVFISSVEKKDDKGYFFYYINPTIKPEKFPGFIDQIKQYSRLYT